MARAELSSMKHVSKTNSRRSHHPHGAHSAHSAQGRRRPEALRVEPIFCPVEPADPFDTVEWDTDRVAAIKDESGEALFEQTNIEIPKTWTQLATNVVV